MVARKDDFALYCCELLSSAGPCTVKRMFGGFGIGVDGLSIAWVMDLGDGETLWLKADNDTRDLYEAAGCKRFTYTAKGVEKTVNYYSAPDETMESPQHMASWARLALEAALRARKAPAKRPAKARQPAARKRS
ncbi:MAG: TfoX/Sxy family protein [Burkholderiaceae bacterium]|nr:TfoX/Sxy family protein [Burkholderiaceae bacterium]MDZ4143602.1 TfoX/Sxy family protein [Burkholderiales bacterium]